jgi:hypothetical protein
MADFKTPSLAGSSAEFNSVLSTFDSIKSEVVAGLEADVADLVANLTISVVGDLASKLGDLVPEIPELPNVNLQSEMSSLLDIDQSTLAGQLEFENKKAALEFQFGEGLTAGGYDLDTLTANATAAKAAALTATTDIASATTALSDARGEVTSSLDTALDASNKLDRSNVPNPTALINNLSASTTSAVSALSSQASSFQSLTDARAAGTRIQDVVPNFEVLASGGVAFEKASAVLQPTVDTVEEEVSTVVENKEFAEALALHNSILENFERDTPKVLPTKNAGAYAVTNKAKKITVTHTPEESTVSSNISEPKEFQQSGATVTSTVTTSKDSVKKVPTSDGGETILRSNVTPHGFSRRPTSKVEKVFKRGDFNSVLFGKVKTETFPWQDENDNSGNIRIDVITLSDKPVEIVAVKGMVASGKDKGKLKMLIPAGQWNTEKRDVYSIDDDGRILIGWADSNGAPPLDEVAGRVASDAPDAERPLEEDSSTFKNGIWVPFHLYGPKETKRRTDKYTYKVGYRYNDNYDPTFDGNEEAVKEKGNPKGKKKEYVANF